MNYTCENPGCSGTTLGRHTCELCSSPRYCSEVCRAEHWDSSHSIFCSSTSGRLSLTDFSEIETTAKKLLGRGAYGQVKLLHHMRSLNYVAMKQVSKDFIHRNASKHLIRNEIRVQKSLSHPNIIKLLASFEDPEYIYMLLEYASGGSLFQLIRRTRGISEEMALKYIVQICFGLKYLHNRNIVHRDIKPENLLLDSKGTVKICDFGWCVQSNKVRNTFCGTPDYMAPEMFGPKGHSFQVDSWALGVLLYELLHGLPPFRARSDSEKRAQILSNKLAFKEGLSEEVKDLMRALVQSDPEVRLSLDGILTHP